jgi:esterase/lipase
MHRLLLFLFLLFLIPLADASTSGDSNSKKQYFPEASPDFSKYIEQVEQYLLRNSLPGRRESEIRLNLPFELTASSQVPYRGKYLLIHGLNDSAYVWTDMAQALAARGFDVRAILLPGHGSHPAKMLNISFKNWLRTVRRHYENWQVDDTPIFVGGFSLGAVLATILALEKPEIAGLILISPAYHSQLNSLLRWSGIYAWFKPWMFGGLITEDNPVKYNSIPINSAAQYFNTTLHLKKELRDDKKPWLGERLRMPVMMALTANDSVVDVEYSRNLFHKHFRNPLSRLLIYQQPTTTAQPREVIRKSNFPQRRILNLSHLSLLNAPRNPLFGENGSVLVCNGNEYPIYQACRRASGHWFGAQHTPSPDGIAVARSTYNPDFDFLIELFDQVFPLQSIEN